jgi:hypothetical protein
MALTVGEWVAHCRKWNIIVAGDNPLDVINVPESVQFNIADVPGWLPSADPIQPYTGAGPNPSWLDVYNSIVKDIKKQKTAYGALQDAAKINDLLQNQLQTVGALVKALSYFLIQDEQSNVALHNELVLAIDELQLNMIEGEIQIGLILANIPAQILEGVAAAVGQSQATTLEAIAQQKTYIDGIAALNRQWALDTIYAPLTENIGQVAANAEVQTVKVAAQIVPVSQVVAATAVAPVASEVAQLAPALTFVEGAVHTLQDQATNCVNDMCATMGPKTDLGKFLKALNLAGEAALLAYLAGLDGAGINQLLQNLVTASGTAIDDISSLFTGGATVGDLLAKISV